MNYDVNSTYGSTAPLAQPTSPPLGEQVSNLISYASKIRADLSEASAKLLGAVPEAVEKGAEAHSLSQALDLLYSRLAQIGDLASRINERV